MLEAKDIKYLTHYEGRRGVFIIGGIGVAVLFCVVMIVVYQYRASEIASRAGHDLAGLWDRWHQGFEAGQQYSGVYLLALERLDASLLAFYTAAVGTIMLFISVFERRRRRRIVTLFREHGIWEDSRPDDKSDV